MKHGDLIFGALREGTLNRAIEDVTCRQFEVAGPRLSHVGWVEIDQGSKYVIHAYQTHVQRMPLAQFLVELDTRPENASLFFLAEIVFPDSNLTRKIISEAKSYLQVPFDETYGIHRDKFNCASFVDKVISSVSETQDFLAKYPMYFGEVNDPDDVSYGRWKEHFDRLNLPVPSGLPGISPLSIYLSPNVRPRILEE